MTDSAVQPLASRKSKHALRETLEGYLWAAPCILGLLIFRLFPILFSFLLSFMKWDILGSIEWAGFANFGKQFTDHLFWQSLKVTASYSFAAVPLRLAVALFAAILLNQKVNGMSLFRTIFYLPSVVSGVAIALLWSWVFNPTYGILNLFLGKLGLPTPGWFTSMEWVIPTFVIMSAWGFGGSMVIFLAGLQSIPTHLYEVATIDGAGRIIKFFKITIPMLSPVIFFNLVLGIIQSFQIFTQAFIITEGGPANASLFYVLYIYRKAFEGFEMGYASSLALILFFIILLMTLLVFKSSSLWVYYEGMKSKKAN